MIFKIAPLNPSTGNHIPDNTDCPAMMIDETPPIDFSEHKEPNKIPKAMNNSDVIILIKTPNTIPKPNSDESNIPPTKKKRID